MDFRLCSVRVSIHAGMTEMGAFGHSCTEQHGLHVNEVQTGELILTNLGCWGSPAIRYRTGDLIRQGGSSCACGRTFLILPGGVLGRVDDMLIVRGVSVYPSALANILHRFSEVSEYRVIVISEGPMDEIALQVECPPQLKATIAEELHVVLNLRVPIETVEPGTFPRFELKSRCVEDRRKKA